MKKTVKSSLSIILSLVMIVSIIQINSLTVKADGKVEDIFSDIKGDEWFVPFVQFVYDNRIMTGKGDKFDPGGNMQREEIAQIIYNMAGKPEIPADAVNPFSDVKNSDWFYKSVVWCSQNGIVGGVGNGKFGKGQKITRQDFALMLYKYAELTESPSINDIDNSAIEGYADTDKVSNYAKTAMNWAISNGLISGKGKSGAPKSELKLDPKGNTTRAEGATLITRFYEINANPNTPKVGDIIIFGQYEQDGNTANGKEDIEWEVLSVKGNQALIISRYALDCKPYNNEETDVTWETCTLRKWLNNDFINVAFNDAEKNKIPTVTLENKDNPKYGTHGGNKTNDKVFCLSLEEMEKYYSPYNWYDSENMYGYNQKLICTPTQYVIDNRAGIYTITEDDYNNYLKEYDYTSDVIGRCGCWWWLRTPGYSGRACDVDYYGEAGAANYSVMNSVNDAVRPALYIDFD